MWFVVLWVDKSWHVFAHYDNHIDKCFDWKNGQYKG